MKMNIIYYDLKADKHIMLKELLDVEEFGFESYYINPVRNLFYYYADTD